ncbi:hypothetical protein PGB90_005473 [Kerria lacca]
MYETEEMRNIKIKKFSSTILYKMERVRVSVSNFVFGQACKKIFNVFSSAKR